MSKNLKNLPEFFPPGALYWDVPSIGWCVGTYIQRLKNKTFYYGGGESYLHNKKDVLPSFKACSFVFQRPHPIRKKSLKRLATIYEAQYEKAAYLSAKYEKERIQTVNSIKGCMSGYEGGGPGGACGGCPHCCPSLFTAHQEVVTVYRYRDE